MAATLDVRMTSDGASAVAADFAAVGSAAKGMGADVDAGTRDASAAASRMDGVAESADGMASSSSQAAGGLGDLGGALSLMPGPLGAVGAGMEAVAPAIMGVTGAADLLNLVTKSNIVLTARQKVGAVASAVAQKAVAAATKVWAAGQWLLNAALTANPIGIVVVAVAALVAGIILAYKNSETFRKIVDAAMRGARTAVGWVVDRVSDLVDYVRDKAPPVWDKVKNAAVTAFELMTAPIRNVYNLVQDVIGAVQDLIGWIADIDFPDIPDIPGFRTVVGGGTTTTGGGRTVTSEVTNTFNVTISGELLDPAGTARAIDQLLRDYGFTRGTASPLAPVG